MTEIIFLEGNAVLDFINEIEDDEAKTKMLESASNTTIGSLVVGLNMKELGKQAVYFRKFEATTIVLIGKGENLRSIADGYLDRELIKREEYDFLLKGLDELRDIDIEFEK